MNAALIGAKNPAIALAQAAKFVQNAENLSARLIMKNTQNGQLTSQEI